MKLNLNSFKWHFVILLLLSSGSVALGQTKLSPDSIVSKNVNRAGGLKQQFDMAKGMFWHPKAKDTVFVMVSHISFSDPNLALLKSAFGKKKANVKSMLREGTVILKVAGKEDAGSMYDGLDAALKKMFEPQDIQDTQMILVYKPAN